MGDQKTVYPTLMKWYNYLETIRGGKYSTVSKSSHIDKKELLKQKLREKIAKIKQKLAHKITMIKKIK